MRIYISGAMTSDPDYEEKFNAAERWIRRKYPDAEVVNPETERILLFFRMEFKRTWKEKRI